MLPVAEGGGEVYPVERRHAHLLLDQIIIQLMKGDCSLDLFQIGINEGTPFKAGYRSGRRWQKPDFFRIKFCRRSCRSILVGSKLNIDCECEVDKQQEKKQVVYQLPQEPSKMNQINR